MARTEQTARKSTGGKRNTTSSLTGLHLGVQELEDRILAERTTTQLRNVPSISDIVGCDITLEDVQSTKQELINQKFDLKMDVNKYQEFHPDLMPVTPMIHFCRSGNLLIVKLLFLMGADCTKLCKDDYHFPMFAAAQGGHLDICKWLFEYGGDAKYQINKETRFGDTPLSESYGKWHRPGSHGIDKEGKTCRLLLRNGGGQHLSSDALRMFGIDGIEEANSNLLVLWTRENIQLHDTFMLLLYGAATMNATLLSSEISDGSTRKSKRQRKGGRKRMIHRER